MVDARPYKAICDCKSQRPKIQQNGNIAGRIKRDSTTAQRAAKQHFDYDDGGQCDRHEGQMERKLQSRRAPPDIVSKYPG